MSTSRTREKADGELFKSTGIDDNATSTAVTIDANENVLVGTTNNLPAVNNVEGIALSSGSYGGRLEASRDGGAPAAFNRIGGGSVVEIKADGTTVGSIGVTSSGTTYNTTSDRRLKDNIYPIADATNKLMDMNPVSHTWINNPEAPHVHGFIAQEMQEIIPEAVSGDPESDEMMSMDYGRITPVIVAALQDALKEIKELKIRIDELENK